MSFFKYAFLDTSESGADKFPKFDHNDLDSIELYDACLNSLPFLQSYKELEETIGSRTRHISYDRTVLLTIGMYGAEQLPVLENKKVHLIRLVDTFLTSLTILQEVGRDNWKSQTTYSYDKLSYLPSVCWELSKFQNSKIKKLISLDLS